MSEDSRNDETQESYPVETVKVVAEMPGDKEMRDSLQEMKENDGYTDSCAIHPQSGAWPQMSEDKSKHDDEENFFVDVAKAANFVNDRLDDTIAPGGLNNTVEEYATDDKEEK